MLKDNTLTTMEVKQSSEPAVKSDDPAVPSSAAKGGGGVKADLKKMLDMLKNLIPEDDTDSDDEIEEISHQVRLVESSSTTDDDDEDDDNVSVDEEVKTMMNKVCSS